VRRAYVTRIDARAHYDAGVGGCATRYTHPASRETRAGVGRSTAALRPLAGSARAWAGDGIGRRMGDDDAVTVLLVDDEPQLLRLVGRVLERAGFTVLSARDGREALEVFEAHRDEIDLAILDVLVPPNGIEEVLRVMLAQREDLRVILASGDELSDSLRELLRGAGGAFLRKPFVPKGLLRVIEEVRATTPEREG